MVSALAAFLAKLLWRRELKSVAWFRMAGWACAACAAVLLAGLVVFGRDGMIATYAVMVLVCAAALWVAAFGTGRRK